MHLGEDVDVESQVLVSHALGFLVGLTWKNVGQKRIGSGTTQDNGSLPGTRSMTRGNGYWLIVLPLHSDYTILSK